MVFASVSLAACHTSYTDWRVYGGAKTATHYSSLSEVDTTNVQNLAVAWEYHTGDAGDKTQMQVNPLVIKGILYGVSAQLKLFALDAFSGKALWVFDPTSKDNSPKGKGYFSMNVCRGVSYYQDPSGVDNRLFYAAGSRLYCINAADGKPEKDFADSGSLDLHRDLGERAQDLYVASTSPGMIFQDMIIIGTRVAEDAKAAPGHIRAYDVHSGKLRWIFHTIPQPGEAGFDSWEDSLAYQHIGGANAWSGFSLDEETGVLYAPVGSASYDFYGGKRLGNDLYANCILALDAATGKQLWHYQTVHHDVWDRDLPTAPVLVTTIKDGNPVKALAQITKSGFIFLLDRKTGEPLYPIAEKPVPTDTQLAGEHLSATQPIPDFPEPFSPQSPLNSEAGLNHLLPDSSYQAILATWKKIRHDHIYAPPSFQGTLILPGFDGGGEWGGPAYDTATDILYVNASHMANILTMVSAQSKTKGPETNLLAGQRLYRTNCMSCHGTERQGSGNYPSLQQIGKRYDDKSFAALLQTGRRMMPAFRQLSAAEQEALASFLLDQKKQQAAAFKGKQKASDPYYNLPYTSTGYNKFISKEGYSAVDTPWGTLNAINLHTGKKVWTTTLGDYPEFKAKGIHTGTETYGGPVVTEGGLVFIASTRDATIRAFNKRTGKLLWEHALPASGFATPALYARNGKQYLVIACGGGKLNQPSGDSYLAFALPDK